MEQAVTLQHKSLDHTCNARTALLIWLHEAGETSAVKVSDNSKDYEIQTGAENYAMNSFCFDADRYSWETPSLVEFICSQNTG